MPEHVVAGQENQSPRAGILFVFGPVAMSTALWLFAAATVVSSAGSGAADVLPLRPDLQRERRMADQIVDAILDGESLSLEGEGGHRFLAIYTEATRQDARGTAIVLHGRGIHPDWANVVQPLRVGLTGHGWNTLSIQLPVLHKAATYYDYVSIFDAAMPRIEAAIAHVRRRDDGPVVLIAHSCGNHMAQHWVRVRGDAALGRFDAFVGIGMGATDRGQPMREPFVLERMKMPILDLYGEDDYPAVRDLADVRLTAISRAGNGKSRQRQVAAANHDFVDRGEVLVRAVADWLDTL